MSNATIATTFLPTSAPSFVEAAIYTQPYRAEFQHFRSNLCDGDDPTVRVYCFGGSFRIDDTSDNIVCGDIQTRPDSQWQFIECTTTCTTDACRETTFLNVNDNVLNVDTGPFARVDFTCAGNLLSNINAGFEYLGGEPATCTTSSSSNTLNYHVARLSVECPDQVSGERQFVLDDLYTECVSSRPFSPDFGPSNLYHCEEGSFCDQPFCDIQFDDFVINADIVLFAHQCTESLLPIAAPTPPAPPPPTTNTDSLFVSQFRAAFGIFFEDQFSDCSGNAPSVSITCPLGDISLINTTFSTTSCQKTLDDSVLECVDSQGAIDVFAEVTYNCTGFTEQETVVEYQPNEAFCDDPIESAHVSHMVQLGVACDVGDGLETFFVDAAVECGILSNEFASFNAQGTTDFPTRYTCLERVLFPAGSTTANRLTIPVVRMQTNYDWALNPVEGCHFELPNFVSPTSLPTSSQPTLAPIRGPTPAPVVPRPVPVPNDSSSPSSSSEGVPLGPIVGGAVGAVAIIALSVIAAVYIRSRANNNDGTSSKNDNSHQPSPPKNPVHYEEEQPPHYPPYPDPTHTAGASESGHQDNLYDDDPSRGNYGYDRAPVASYDAPLTRTNTLGARSSGHSNGTAEYSRRTPEYSAPGRPIQFKDQTRTVIEDGVPTVEGVATGEAPPDGMPVASAAPMMDVSEVTDHSSGHNNRSGNHSRGGSTEPSGIRLDP